ncbi:hypothetical protein [Kineococcus rhizosphaerae]|uniref:Uncharacterized protein n=1 Tax=Kineococcus rhizosphaerae TaxID=559628 RepID=A0A2T0R1F7_9ACTN|nr:hypothetical protein [Kineococcus rhizosphaerae]PRY13382.1 hypothetical protein CLV37_10850 [Kineococcus rhizosphaerae]
MTGAVADEVVVEVDAPDGWVLLPLDPGVDALAWALSAHRVLGGTLPPEPARAVAAVLAEHVLLARRDLDADLDLALVLVADPDAPALVAADVRAGLDDGFVAAGEEAFAHPGRVPAGLTCLDAEASDVDLPAGPARRVRLVVAEDAPGGRVAESLNLLVRPAAGGRLVLRARWEALGRSAELAGAVDALARTLAVHPSGAPRPANAPRGPVVPHHGC